MSELEEKKLVLSELLNLVVGTMTFDISGLLSGRKCPHMISNEELELEKSVIWLIAM